MKFPSDIKNAMRDCILKLFWPKKDIIDFFSTHGCTQADVKVIGDTEGVQRNQIVDIMFTHLSSKPDEGLGAFRGMLQALTNWSHFEPYYFEKLGKLNRTDAETAIEHLKQIQELRDHKIRTERKEREKKVAETQKPSQTLNSLKNRFLSLMTNSEPPQKRGYELESILMELGKLSELEVTDSFRVNGEQIDGAIKFDGEHYLIEAKWQDRLAANEPVYQFASKVEGKLYGRGIFISINGFSPHVIHSLTLGKSIKTIFVDGGDLIMVLEGYLSFKQMLDKKIKAAQTKGLIYVDAITETPKAS